MATKNMAYDHPQYTVALPLAGGTLSGASGAGQRFAAFTTLLVKSVQLKPVTAGTSNDVASLLTVSGTTTTTTALATFGSGATTGTNVTTTLTLAQGDACWVQKGTDATGVIASGVELAVQAGASTTL